MGLSEQTPDRRGMAVPGRKLAPDFLLCGVILADREGHQLIKVHFRLAIGLYQCRAYTGELEAPLDHHRFAAEARCDFLRSMAFIGERLEGLVLVSRVGRQPHDVLDKADLHRVRLHMHMTWDFGIFRDGFRLGEALERGKAAPASHDLILAIAAGNHLQVLQQPVSGDTGDEFVYASIAACLTRISWRCDQSIERDHFYFHDNLLLGKNTHLSNSTSLKKHPRLRRGIIDRLLG
jgi:hypothetical protein